MSCWRSSKQRRNATKSTPSLETFTNAHVAWLLLGGGFGIEWHHGCLTREAQAACFRNAKNATWEPGGCFVIETYVLLPEQLGGDWSIWPRLVQHEHVELQLSRYDPATQHRRTHARTSSPPMGFISLQ